MNLKIFTSLALTLLLCLAAAIALDVPRPDPQLEARVASVISQNRNAADFVMTAHGKFIEYTNTPPYLSDPNAVILSSALYRAARYGGCFNGFRVHHRRCTDTKINAAVLIAGHHVLSYLYPGWNLFIEGEMLRFYNEIPNGSEKDAGYDIGRRAALDTLKRGILDGRGKYSNIESPGVEGKWEPTPPNFSVYTGGFLANITINVLNHVTEVPPRDPPSFDSQEFYDDVVEVMRKGGQLGQMPNRTQDDLEKAIYTNFMSDQILLGLVKRAQDLNLTLLQSLTYYLITSVSGYEAHVATHYYKTVYMMPRPSTLVRKGLPTLRPDLPTDPTWLNLDGISPANSEYPSGTVGLTTGYVEAARRLSKTVTDEELPFSYVLPKSDDRAPMGPNYEFESTDAVIDAAKNGRVSIGVHLGYSCRAGEEQGRRIAELVVERMCRMMRCMDPDRPSMIPTRYYY